jgi:hypothetical protein
MPTAAVLGGFVVHGGCLWCASANGRIYRLPLHGYNWAWAEQHARQHERWLDAAACLVWADAREGDRRAAEVLAEHGEPARADAISASLRSLTETTHIYHPTGKLLKLPGSQFKLFQDALLSAFDSSTLRIMVRTELDEELDTIASGSNLGAVVFELITWAQRTGRLDALLDGALNAVPGSPDLQALAKTLRG